MLAFSGKKFLVRWFSTNVYAGARAFLGKSNFLFGSGYAGLGPRSPVRRGTYAGFSFTTSFGFCLGPDRFEEFRRH